MSVPVNLRVLINKTRKWKHTLHAETRGKAWKHTLHAETIAG